MKENNKIQAKVHRIFRLFKKESYTLIAGVKEQALKKLGVKPQHLVVDMFANSLNKQSPLFCTRQNSAFGYDWTHLLEKEEEILWANPPFSQLVKVLTKLVLEPTRMVLVTPKWENTEFWNLLDLVKVAQVEIEGGTPLYIGDWDSTPLPSPSWQTLVTLVDTTKVRPPLEELDKQVVRWLRKVNKGWGREELKIACANVTQEFQELGFKKASPPLTVPFMPFREVEVLAELSIEVESASPASNAEDLLTVFPHQGEEKMSHARPSSQSVVDRQELERIGQEVQQDIFYLESQLAEKENPFTYEENTGNLQGDFDLSRFSGQPKLVQLLQKYQEIFGPLPPQVRVVSLCRWIWN